MNNPIKILTIAPYKIFPPKMGGQKGIALFNKYLSKIANLICITTNNNELNGNEGYEIMPILSSKKFRYINVFYFFKLKKIIRQNTITHLIIEHPYYGWLGFLLKKFTNVKLIFHTHNIEAERFKSMKKWWWPIMKSYEKWVLSIGDYVFFISPEDLNYGITTYKLTHTKCSVITYGFEMAEPPTETATATAHKSICAKYNIDESYTLILFNGTLDYMPNLQALEAIINNINPILKSSSFNYKILVCGKNLPSHYLEMVNKNNIIYLGFVDDIDEVFKACTIFINPVIEGGGIKTKLVEALGFNRNVITTKSGAIGVPLNLTGNKMKIIDDNDWENFANEIIKFNNKETIPEAFFNHFYWGNIAKKVITLI